MPTSGLLVIRHLGHLRRVHACNNVALIKIQVLRTVLHGVETQEVGSRSPVISGGKPSNTAELSQPEYLNRFGGSGIVIAMASESEPRVFWFTRKMILTTSVSTSIRCATVRVISRLRCQPALSNSGPTVATSSRSRFVGFGSSRPRTAPKRTRAGSDTGPRYLPVFPQTRDLLILKLSTR